MEGYEKLAQLMGNSRTDGHFLIFQKFADLSALNLLYLQAEIVNLRETLAGLAKEDAESTDPERRLFTRDWWALSSADDREQWETFLQLRSKLKDYYEAMAQHQMISNLPQPHKRDLAFLQGWLERPNMGNCSFVGADRLVYETNISGLATLASSSGSVDPLTRLLLYSLPKLYHRVVVYPLYLLIGRWVKKPEGHVDKDECETKASTLSSKDSKAEDECNRASCAVSSASQATVLESDRSLDLSKEQSFDVESNIFLYRDSHFHRVANIVGTLAASLIPTGATVVLYFVTDMPTRLAMVSLFTAIFAITLSLVTSASRVEIFAATAAFASVQVVFVGSTTSL